MSAQRTQFFNHNRMYVFLNFNKTLQKLSKRIFSLYLWCLRPAYYSHDFPLIYLGKAFSSHILRKNII